MLSLPQLDTKKNVMDTCWYCFADSMMNEFVPLEKSFLKSFNYRPEVKDQALEIVSKLPTRYDLLTISTEQDWPVQFLNWRLTGMWTNVSTANCSRELDNWEEILFTLFGC